MSEDTYEARRTRISGMLRPDTVFVLPSEVDMGKTVDSQIDIPLHMHFTDPKNSKMDDIRRIGHTILPSYAQNLTGASSADSGWVYSPSDP